MTELRLSRNADSSERRMIRDRRDPAPVSQAPEERWLRLLTRYGFGSALAVYVLWHSFTVSDVKAEEQLKLSAQIQVTATKTLEAINELKEGQASTERLLRAICENTARSDVQRQLCRIP